MTVPAQENGAPPAAAAGRPSRAECWVDKKADEKCWAWRDPGSKGPRDPAELPVGKAEHARRLAAKSFGPAWSRLCPTIFLEERAPNVLVRDTQTKAIYDVPSSQLLPWYEGLLVLDAMSRCSEASKALWFQELQEVLIAARRSRRLTAALYVEKRLLDCAVTGPCTQDSQGVAWAHRRRPLRKDPPGAAGKAEGAWFRIDALVEYLPPWEALVHPKCGLYQEFYMVKWAPPFNNMDYSVMENGSETLCGATWEPDECLPDILDVLKVRAKRKWIESQREREQRPQGLAERPQAARPTTPAENEARAAKRTKMFNPKMLPLVRDYSQPTLGHAIVNPIGEDADESEIKKGWPKKAEDHPAGHAPADPPGYCSETCSCMEDWHLGKLPEGGKDHLANHNRDAMASRVVQAFQDISGYVRKRGTVTGRCYLEPGTGAGNPRPDGQTEAALAEASKGIQKLVEQVAQNLPLTALRDKRGAGILQALSPIFTSRVPATHPQEEFSGAHGPYLPCQFRITAGAPSWLTLWPHTGDVNVRDDDVPALLQKKAMPMQVAIMAPGVPDEAMKISVIVEAKAHGGGALEPLTREVVKIVKVLPATYRALVEARLVPIYDFSANQCKVAHTGVWVKAVSDVVLMLQSAASAHVLPV